MLQRFNDPQALLKAGDNLFSGMAAAGPLGGGTPWPNNPAPMACGVH